MRAVLDTNVLLSGLLTRGVCEALLDVCLSSEACTVVLSEHILREFARHAREKFGIPSDGVDLAIEFLRRHVEFVEPASLPRNTCRDQGDLPVLGTAVAAKADVLITGDQDLLDLGETHGVPIVSPRAFYERLR